jgi:hypothetical protein
MLLSPVRSDFKEIILLFLMALILSFASNAQQVHTDSMLLGSPINPKSGEEQSKSNHQWGIDFHAIGISLHGAVKLDDGFFVGGEFGAFPNAFDRVLLAGKHFTEENTKWSNDRSLAEFHNLRQFYFLHLFARWKPPTSWLEMDTGYRLARYKNNIPFEDSYGFPAFQGGYWKVLLGSKKFKGGVSFLLGDMVQKDFNINTREFVIIFSPLIRFNFQ